LALKGFSASCPDNDAPEQLNKQATLANLTQIIGSFNHYFTNPAEDFPLAWQQCHRCLKVNHITITEDHRHTLLMDCNQMVNAAQSTVLNSKTHKFEKSIMTWVNSQQNTAHNQVIESILETNHPPSEADPCILKWIDHQAKELRMKAQNEAVQQAK
jgi:hypothetical protein